MRKPLIVANWKMNGSLTSIAILLTELLEGCAKANKAFESLEIVVCPPSPYFALVQERIQDSCLQLGAQNVYSEKKGAFTGEISVSMLNDFSCHYVILGHSERRQLFGETNALIARKCLTAYHAGLNPILCLGETAEEREGDKTFEVLTLQLESVLNQVLLESQGDKALLEGFLHNLVLAYEPVWAIGTGKTARPEEAQEVHAFLRDKVDQFFPGMGKMLRILYGGSVNESNAKALFAMPDIDGGLIGGASLISKDFLKICHSVINH